MLHGGFHLSALVLPPQSVAHSSATILTTPHDSGSSTKGAYNVAVVFGRRRITNCSCSCTAGVAWCSHVVALCLFRIHRVLLVNFLRIGTVFGCEANRHTVPNVVLCPWSCCFFCHCWCLPKQNLLHVPRHQFGTYGCSAFAVASPSTWKSFPDPFCNQNTTKAA